MKDDLDLYFQLWVLITPVVPKKHNRKKTGKNAKLAIVQCLTHTERRFK